MRVRLQFLLALGLCGCAPVQLQGKYDYEEGWREGVVSHLVGGEEMNVHATIDCRSDLSPERLRTMPFALVRFNNGRSRVFQIVSLAAPAAPGDAVLVKMNDCSQPGLPFSHK